ncbi:hypothetical protein CPB86DRAFT_807665 [Serendipita vermifera]|nr:hypothetical protein CPB86DRAFT_807665 [Serendipita vermifera]
MSDDDFLDDEIYALATTPADKKRKKRASEGKSSARKRVRTDLGASDMDESDAEPANPYPLEGKYKDEADRRRLEEMPEMQREEILAQRQEEMQTLTDKINLSKLLASQRDLGGGGMADDSVAQAAKRKRMLTGSAREKANTRDVLKASRRAKEERKAHHVAGAKDSPSKSARRASDSSDMDTSSDNEEGTPPPRSHERSREKPDSQKKDERKLTKEDLCRIQLTRTQLAKQCMKPWFEEYIKGAFVRFLLAGGDGREERVYRVCEVKGLGPTTREYTVENERFDRQILLAIGNSVRPWTMDKVSNSPFTDREFNRLVVTCQNERVTLPSVGEVVKRREKIKQLEEKKLTEADVSAMIARRKMLRPGGLSFQQRIAEKSRLIQELNTAYARHDKAEAARLKEELDKFLALHGESESAQSGSDTEGGFSGLKRDGSRPSLGSPSKSDSILEELSRRNREANHATAKRIEEERRRKIQLQRQQEAEATKLAALKAQGQDDAMDTYTTEQDLLKNNPELAGKDIGTKMAHMVEIDLPDF